MLALLLSRPGRWLEGRGGEIRPFGPVQILAYLAIGVYAGLVVLGSGFFMLAAFVLLTGYDLIPFRVVGGIMGAWQRYSIHR